MPTAENSARTRSKRIVTIWNISRISFLRPTEAMISSVERHVMHEWMRSMDGAKPRTIRRRLPAVKSMVSSLERHGNLETNPLSGFRCEVKLGKSLPRTLPRSTVKSLLRSPRGGELRSGRSSEVDAGNRPTEDNLLDRYACERGRFHGPQPGRQQEVPRPILTEEF